MRRFSRTGSQRRVGVPSTSTSPALGKSKPFTILSAVVLPEPLRPSSTNVSPASTERVKLFRISRAPMRYDAARNSRTALTRRETRRGRSRGEQAGAEAPAVVKPLRPALEACRGRHLADLPGVELVARLRPDS